MIPSSAALARAYRRHPLLVEHFNLRFSATGRSPKVFSSEAIEKLQAQNWFGNVRELKNTIERIIIMHHKDAIKAGDIPEPDAHSRRPSDASFRFPNFKEATDAYQREFIVRKIAK